MPRLEVECLIKNDTSGSLLPVCLFTEIDYQIKLDFRMDVLSFFYTSASASVEQKDRSVKCRLKHALTHGETEEQGLPTKYRLVQ